MSLIVSSQWPFLLCSMAKGASTQSLPDRPEPSHFATRHDADQANRRSNEDTLRQQISGSGAVMSRERCGFQVFTALTMTRISLNSRPEGLSRPLSHELQHSWIERKKDAHAPAREPIPGRWLGQPCGACALADSPVPGMSLNESMGLPDSANSLPS
jgi:hypothetical protein